MSVMREVADLQAAYQRLIDERRLTKKAMCDLCIPFRDKYGLKDSQALRIARNERWTYKRWQICWRDRKMKRSCLPGDAK